LRGLREQASVHRRERHFPRNPRDSPVVCGYACIWHRERDMADQMRRLVQPASDVLVQQLPEDETVFLDLDSERYYGLDSVGTAMWAALIETGDVDQALQLLGGEFDVDQETLSRDLDAFVGRLAEQGLLLVGDDAVAASPADPSG
jgi:hypothetical protein